MNKNLQSIHTTRANLALELAWLSVIAAVLLLAIGIGCMLATADDWLFTALVVAVITAGIIGANYLATRH